jgi:hypothetical protein
MPQLRKLQPSKQPDHLGPDLAPLNIIRNETVLSRLPIHRLSKKGSVDINIVRKDANGEVQFRWQVEPNTKHGAPGPLAYKLDTIVVNRRIDELGRPLPEYVRLGSLRDIGKELGLGSNTSKVTRALRQNSRATIVAKLRYKDTDGNEQNFSFEDTRYGLFFTGQKFTSGPRKGETADAVYLSLHPDYRHLLNSARVRPLDYDYLKSLTPAAQRFYELASYSIFTALKYKHAHAKLLYSEYCLFSAQKRHFDYENFRVQMYKVCRPHLKSGYIRSVRHEATADSEGKLDWVMMYTPGPKAKAEYGAFNKQRVAQDDEAAKEIFPQQELVSLIHAIPSPAEELVGAFYKRFHGAAKAYPGVNELTQAQTLIDKHGLERARHIIEYAYHAASETKYKPQTFNGILHYATPALATYDEEQKRKQANATIDACKECDSSGWIHFQEATGHTFTAKCPHDLRMIQAREQRDGLMRIL